MVGLLELGSQPSAGSVHTQLSGTRASPRSALPTRSLLSWHSCHLARLTSSQPLALLHIPLQHGVTCRGERHQGVGTSEHPVSVSQFCSVFCATRITPCGSGNSGSQLPRRLSDNPLSSGWGSLISGAGSDPAWPPLCPPSCLLSGSFEPWPRKGSGSFRGSSPSLWVPLGWLLVTGNDKGSPVLSHLSGSHMGESRFLRPRLRSDPLGLGFTPGLPAGRAGDSASLGSEVPVALPCGFSGGSAAGQKRQTTEQGCWTGNAPRAPHGVVRSHFRPPEPPGLGPAWRPLQACGGRSLAAAFPGL